MMKENKKIYWKGIDQLTNDTGFVRHADKEFVDLGVAQDPGHKRRDFLKMMGFGMTAVTLAACEAPIRKAIPYVNKPEDVDPGIANWYASTYTNGGDYCSILVKTREGRPIKVEGNSLSSVTQGGVTAQVEASVLSLYDNARLRGPKRGGQTGNLDWQDLDKEVIAKLAEIAAKGGQIRIVSNTILSPSTKAVLAKFASKYATAKHVVYDPVSSYGIALANKESFGGSFIPSYDFSKAKVIVSIASDFLSTGTSPVESVKQYARTREVSENKREMSRHFQFESILSLTGANADYRTAIKPSEEGAVVVALYNLIAAKAGQASVTGGTDKEHLAKAAEELWAARGQSVVVAGSNNKSVQVVVNAINSLLGNYGATILPGSPVNFRQGNDEEMSAFIDDAAAGRVEAAIFYGCNPVYDHPKGGSLAEALKNIPLSVSTSYKEEETGTLCQLLAPDHHYLESWGDAEPKPGMYSLCQPAITPIFKSRAAQESLLIWAGEAQPDYFSIVKENWRQWFYKGQAVDFQTFWDKCLYDGIYEIAQPGSSALIFAGDLNAAVSTVTGAAGSGFEIVLYESALGNGSMSNNPLLLELPDPITKATWDHYVTVSQKDAADLGLPFSSEGWTQTASITVNGNTFNLPVLIQPGQATGTLGVAVGYGRTKAGRAADGLGFNAYTLAEISQGSVSYAASGASLALTGEKFQLAQTQTHQTYMGRSNVIQEARLAEFKDDPGAGREHPHVTKWDEVVAPGTLSLWKGHKYPNHQWGMAIDMNTCIGCAACVVSCNVENNIALVGKQEVINRREMHWLRIDRYYSYEPQNDGDLKLMENAAENPEVVFQPMLCQHCNNASCETVCPVAATTHSTEGLNQMAYNRCIGTRYCANNCAYKVRRFNWFKYHDNDDFLKANPAQNTNLGKMVLNPDVTVRSRGVMEKCSFCVQRIQLAKLTAKKDRRPVKDGEVVTACQAACSTGAIVFGDMNDPESRISKLLQIETKSEEDRQSIDKKVRNPRAYTVLEEIGVKPNIYYLTKIKNKDEALNA
jgi:molybdopterin-containing oxidoreductase family iron-sulfur binding subunit